ncbi:bifunctional 3'-5' exonuclease/DNA polymerase [Microbacterium sp.]|uniref:bifunctional 3'-5' exonuclease/DNA polymerase n=1 Tax=Microbacterium sp. TaxID=51671 RepID=UPI003A958810
MSAAAAWTVVGVSGDTATLVGLDADGGERGRDRVPLETLAQRVAAREAAGTRWVWSDTARVYPALLHAGVRVLRCRDLRLCHAILRDTALLDGDGSDAAAAAAAQLRAAAAWDAPAVDPGQAPPVALFELDGAAGRPAGPPQEIGEVLAEFARQRAAVAASTQPRRLDLLCAVESAGALVAAEMTAAGLPWDTAAHDAILTEVLGARPAGGGAPRRVAETAATVRALLGDDKASLDSPPKLLRSLHRVGVPARTTAKWELREYDHPVIAPLLEYKALMRLFTANGWAWLADWVRDGRFRPVYIPAGVVTGRWASSGGGALQIPRRLRAAVRADPGWTFVVADVAQLEPRVLAAMSGDTALAAAARGSDLYSGIVDSGAVATRAEAKVAMLGAMYGATTGESGRLVPRLRRTYRRAMALVDTAAREGERGGVVSTWLGRTSPAASRGWREVQSLASDENAGVVERERARRAAGDRGRFTRNFVVQGTAAEWALAWLAEVRLRLAALAPVPVEDAAPRSGPAFSRTPHLAFFLHDELIVHTPAARADEVDRIVRDAAAAAASLLFGDFPIDFPLDLHISPTGEKG